MNDPNQFLENFTAWAQKQSSIRGVSVVGSYARGTACAKSDIDLVILCQNPLEVEFGLTSTEWASVPVDPGPHEVVSAGMKILHDPESLFEQLEKAVVS